MLKFKRILFATLLCMATCLTANAQDETNHLEFKGIPIDGNMSSFLSKMNEKGFKTVTIQEEGTILSGQFAGENVDIIVYASPKSKTVYMVTVVFPEKTSWYSLKSNFKNLENSLQGKYGHPTIQRKEFDNPYYEGDGYEMSAVRMDKCSWFSRFSVERGSIDIMITKGKRVALYYSDQLNETKKENEEKSSVYEDL